MSESLGAKLQQPVVGRVAIVGCGLIGSSLARVARRKNIAAHIAVAADKADFTHLERLNGVLRGMDDRDPGNLLAGAYIDYQWHHELVRISGSRAALAAYSKAIPPAVWIAGANYFQLEEARSSLTEHERLVAYMKAGDTLRARDAVAFHFEEAASQIRRAGEARIESYPGGAA